jgi:ParB-like nuclease domain
MSLWLHRGDSCVMRTISSEGFEKPKSISAGAAPMLQWLKITDLVVDPAYQRPIVGNGRRNVDRIARAFCWSCFAPVVVSPVQGGRFAIIDGQHRTTSAAIVGFDSVPCQIVIAAKEEQAAAFKAINGTTTPISRMALHAAALVASEPWAVQIAHVCECAEVELLRYPVPSDKQAPGQTMAIGAVARCLKQYGEATLITALQCVTQTANNQPGALSARTIKALCEVLHGDPRRDSGLALLEAFDSIDLMAIQDASAVDAAVKKVGRVQAMADRIRKELNLLLPQNTCTQKTAGQMASGDDRNVFDPIGHTAPAKFARKLRKRAVLLGAGV